MRAAWAVTHVASPAFPPTFSPATGHAYPLASVYLLQNGANFARGKACKNGGLPIRFPGVMQWSKECKGLIAQGLAHVSITKGEVASVQPQEATPSLGTWALTVGLHPSAGMGGRGGTG